MQREGGVVNTMYIALCTLSCCHVVTCLLYCNLSTVHCTDLWLKREKVHLACALLELQGFIIPYLHGLWDIGITLTLTFGHTAAMSKWR